MADYPETKKTFSQIVDGTTYIEATNANVAYDEIEALQTFVGSLGAGNTSGYSTAILEALRSYRRDARVTYVGVAELSVSAGSVIFESGGKYRMRVNTSATSVTWSDLDTGGESDNTYYVWATADDEETIFDVAISLSDSAPTGYTYYRLLGRFVNATDITEDSVYNLADHLREVDIENILAATLSINDYDTSVSAYTAKSLSNLKIRYGNAAVGANATITITNLGFTSTASYTLVAVYAEQDTADDKYTLKVIKVDEDDCKIRNTTSDAITANWFAIGT